MNLTPLFVDLGLAEVGMAVAELTVALKALVVAAEASVKVEAEIDSQLFL